MAEGYQSLHVLARAIRVCCDVTKFKIWSLRSGGSVWKLAGDMTFSLAAVDVPWSLVFSRATQTDLTWSQVHVGCAAKGG